MPFANNGFMLICFPRQYRHVCVKLVSQVTNFRRRYHNWRQCNYAFQKSAICEIYVKSGAKYKGTQQRIVFFHTTVLNAHKLTQVSPSSSL